jgi:hypothetical protein
MINYEPYKNYFNRIGNNKKNITLINNFIEIDDLRLINLFLDSQRNNDNFMGGKDLQQKDVRNLNPMVADLLNKYETKTYNVVKSFFTDNYGIPINRMPVNATHFVKWIPGMDSKLHCDCEKQDGTPALAANFYQYNVSILMYPNDNYSGGEITFPDYDLSIKPEAGSFIMFPGNHSYKHTVERVKDGVRYTMPSWYSFDIKSDDNDVKRKNWTYEDSVQLWEGLPDFDKIDPIGINVKGKVFDDKKP